MAFKCTTFRSSSSPTISIRLDNANNIRPRLSDRSISGCWTGLIYVLLCFLASTPRNHSMVAVMALPWNSKTTCSGFSIISSYGSLPTKTRTHVSWTSKTSGWGSSSSRMKSSTSRFVEPVTIDLGPVNSNGSRTSRPCSRLVPSVIISIGPVRTVALSESSRFSSPTSGSSDTSCTSIESAEKMRVSSVSPMCFQAALAVQWSHPDGVCSTMGVHNEPVQVGALFWCSPWWPLVQNQKKNQLMSAIRSYCWPDPH